MKLTENLKVVTVVGTRPEVIRLSRVIARLDQVANHILVHTGQNYDYELNQVFFDELSIRKPDYFLEAAGGGVADTISKIIAKSDEVLDREKPDAVLVLGDTNSCLSVIAAKRRKIPIFHMEAGNRCFDARVPEESNRKVVDHLADINLPYSDIAREYLLREGILPDRIVKTGSPMFEVLAHYRPQIEKSSVLSRLGLKEHDYFVISCHREENVDNSAQFSNLIEVLEVLAEHFGKRIIVSTHPRTRKRFDERSAPLPALVELMKPLGFFDYVRLQEKSLAVLSDSGTINEESSILNFPALNIREAHERPEGMEEAATVLTGLKADRILQSLELIADQARSGERTILPVKDYSIPNVSEKVVRVIFSYTDYVNRVVWRKPV